MELGPRRMSLILLVVVSLLVFEFGYFSMQPRIIVNGGGGVGLNHCTDLPKAICDPNTNGNTGACTSITTGPASCLTPQTVETGTTTCTFASPTNVCPTTTITFPTAFSKIPTYSNAWLTAQPPTAAIGGFQSDFLSYQSNGTNLAGTTDNTGQWSNMPAAATPLYGESLNGGAPHEVEVDLQQSNAGRLVVDAQTCSTAVGAKLKIQYGTSQSGPWVDLGVQTLIDQGVNCFAPNVIDGSGYALLPAGAKLQTVFLLVLGVGGGGNGDSPAFSKITFDWNIKAGVCSATTNQDVTHLTKTIMKVDVQCSSVITVIGQTATFVWYASLCTVGASAC